MQKFDYRSPRFAVDLPVEYTLDKSAHSGRCIEISTDGMTLEIEQPLPPNASGTVSISHQGKILELNVRVVHAASTLGGMEFIYKSENERKAVNHLLASLTAPRKASGLALRS